MLKPEEKENMEVGQNKADPKNQLFLSPSQMRRPPLEKWIAEDREKKWTEYQEEVKNNPQLQRQIKENTTFYPEYMLPAIGIPSALGIIGFRLLMINRIRGKQTIDEYLIRTRMIGQVTIVMSLVGVSIAQSCRYLKRKYIDGEANPTMPTD